METICIGCCGDTKTYLPILEMGYDYVELSARQIMELSDTEFEDFLRIYDPPKLPCRGFNDYSSAEHPIIGPQSGSASCKEYACKVCERGSALGISSIGIGAPAARILPEGYCAERGKQDIEQFLRYIFQTAAKKGIIILLEAVHKYLCNFLNSNHEVLDIVKTLKIPNLFIVLDYYHANVMEEDSSSIACVMPYVKHLHISTDLSGHSRGFMREEDIPEMSRLLSNAIKMGYKGGISVEAASADLLKDGEACLKYMRSAIQNAWSTSLQNDK